MEDLVWRRSTRCEAGACVEVGVDWTTSTASAGSGACVQVRRPYANAVYVRDSKNPDGPALRFTAAEWTAFVAGAKAGEFDLS